MNIDINNRAVSYSVKPMITICTPTYNRAHLLLRLYESLKNQNYQTFEWIIVDDGSVDNTKDLIIAIAITARFSVRYFSQFNSGKHIAINKGVSEAKGLFFFILDSDDLLPNNALQIVAEKCRLIGNDKYSAGVAGRKAYLNGAIIGSKEAIEGKYSVLDFRYKYKTKGDMCEVFKTEVLKKYPFPEISNEKFCPEVLVWNRIGKDYILYWFNEIIYTAEYLPGGLTDKIVEIRKKSPIATTMTYIELEKLAIPLFQKVKANINYWRFSFYLKNRFIDRLKQVNILYSIIGLPIGFLMYLKDNFKR